jgi:hypothetical protein
MAQIQAQILSESGLRALLETKVCGLKRSFRTFPDLWSAVRGSPSKIAQDDNDKEHN